jgi:predicted RNA-binding protein (virulence factor B family)
MQRLSTTRARRGGPAADVGAGVVNPAGRVGFGGLLGRNVTLVVRRLDRDVAWLADPACESGGGGDDRGERHEEDERDDPQRSAWVPLPARELPSPPPAIGAELAVFVYLDSSDQPIATTHPPRIALGEVDVLTVSDVAPFGAFVSWGLGKELLVPLREQTRPLRVGDRCAVGLYLDRTERLAGTMRVAEMLRGGRSFAPDEWVGGVAWREEPGLGLFVILERRSLALLPDTEPYVLRVGDAARLRVTHTHPDGKLEVSLRGPKQDEIDPDAERLYALLTAPGGPRLQVGDASSPEHIRAVAGISKKAFKRAAGRLLKTGRAEIDGEGFLRAKK